MSLRIFLPVVMLLYIFLLYSYKKVKLRHDILIIKMCSKISIYWYGI